MNPFSVAIPLWIGLLLIGYVLRERSLRHLDVTQAGTLVFAVRPIRIRFTLTVAGVATILLAARFAFGRPVQPLLMPALIILIAAVAITHWAVRRALFRAQLPSKFLRLYGGYQLFDLAAYLSFFGTMLVSTLMYGHA